MTTTEATKEVDKDPQHDRLLTLIAIERSVRAILLVVIGLVLLTHLHANWATTIQDLARRVGFDPSNNWLRRLTTSAHHLTPDKLRLYGIVALAYGGLEGAEGYGLWRRRRWGEYLTVIATSLLLIPEVDELIRKTTPLKIVALVVNLAVVAYLVWRLRRRGG